MASKLKYISQISVDMQDEDSKLLLSFLKCCDCSDLAQEAVETPCCHALLCSACLEKRDKQCPECQKSCPMIPSHLARRLIGTQPWRCPSCQKETTRSEQADHNLICPTRERRCPAEGCAFSGLPDALLDHLTGAHRCQLLRRAHCLFQTSRRQRRSRRQSDWSGESSDEDYSDNDQLDNPFDSHWRDPSQTHVENTGKNYCHRPLNGTPCDCCDGFCGPNNGCNCASCMRLDLATFHVTTPETLINREGAVSRIGQTGKFYCGRRVMEHDRSTDGYCGPNNGNNCHACKKLDEQLHGRYADIAAEWAGGDAFDSPEEIIEIDRPLDTID